MCGVTTRWAVITSGNVMFVFDELFKYCYLILQIYSVLHEMDIATLHQRNMPLFYVIVDTLKKSKKYICITTTSYKILMTIPCIKTII